MQSGDRVVISGAAGIVAGIVNDVRSVDELPDLDGLRALSRKARAIMREDHFQRVAVLSHPYSAWNVTFVAFENDAGKWFDLRGNEIQLTPIAGSQARA